MQLSDGTLVIAETVGACLTAFSIDAVGQLTDRRCWFDLSTAGTTGQAVLPDGICADAEDGIWVSDPVHALAIRIDRHHQVSDLIRTSQPCFAVGLGGEDGRMLVCSREETSNPNVAARRRTEKLEVAHVTHARR